jgi:endonuclease/exonuclease/phosphatase family metal-dependent hydrolase
MTANLHQRPRAARSLVELVRRERPDVVSLQEITPEVVAALDDAGLDRLLRKRLLDVRGRGSGSAVYTRLPLERGDADGRTVTNARLRPRDAPLVEVLSVHPMVPRREANMNQWRADLRSMPPPTPRGAVRVLAGDFNATLDHAELRRVIARGYEDAADELGKGLHPTWPTNGRRTLPVTIDHVLADERCGFRDLQTFDVAGSDHRAVLVELVLPRG